MSILPAVDAQGHEIPWTEDDRWIECGLDDPDYGEPESWAERYDEAIWELGADPLPEEPYEPTPDDWAGYREFCREVERRLLEARMQSEHDSEMERLYLITDEDVRIAAGAVG